MKKVFLDTNIFIDFFEETRENNQQAKQLIYFLISNDIKIIFSVFDYLLPQSCGHSSLFIILYMKR